VPGFAVTLSANVPIPAGTVCVGYDRLTPVRVTASNKPDCTAVAVIPESIDFQPEDCDPQHDCSLVCAALTAQATPPVDVTLFTCRVAIDPAAPLGTYPLTCTAIFSEIETTCTDGSVVVENRLPGDCNGDGVVTIDELILGVNISLDNLPITACPAFDTDGSGGVSIDELIQAVNAALRG
jgi:hypothetical protein